MNALKDRFDEDQKRHRTELDSRQSGRSNFSPAFHRHTHIPVNYNFERRFDSIQVHAVSGTLRLRIFDDWKTKVNRPRWLTDLRLRVRRKSNYRFNRLNP